MRVPLLVSPRGHEIPPPRISTRSHLQVMRAPPPRISTTGRSDLQVMRAPLPVPPRLGSAIACSPSTQPVIIAAQRPATP
ncbi:hypothetical protein RRG08_027828 [Elysia crispata]|uniref:Uncharacterized protein n=1 Tax=Elysia crispata TaxID=231223 RepID=A0AAE1EDJ1_9GAST|nr:hypothetical protein RRG08_027828 [Elysia crispata]